MFQIGQHLAEQRRRRGLSLTDCEAQTRIRARYLIALEQDRGEELMDPAYVRIFLRDYAQFLGLDAEMLVTELDEQRGDGDHLAEHRLVPIDVPTTAGPVHGDRVRRVAVSVWRRSPPRAVWLGAGLAGAVGVLIALGAGGSGPATLPPTSVGPSAVTTPQVTTPTSAAAAPAAPATVHAVADGPSMPASAVLGLTGTGTYGAYVQLCRGDADGPVVYLGTLAPGSHIQVTITGPMWMRVGWVPGLIATLGGHRLALTGGTADFVVTPTAVRPTA